MDIDYLLLLQSFRDATNNFFTPILYSISEFVVSFVPLAIFCMIYWVYDKKMGTLFLFNWTGATFLNGLIKITACVYRPWIRDSRVIPAGNSKFTATGYSFPSGHSTNATSFYGSLAGWQHKKRMWLSCCFVVMIFLTMFSRNYLGVHTPQDVFVGLFATVIVLVLNYFIFKWFEKNQNKDILILIVGVVLCVAGIIYINLKSYPIDYVDGQMIVNPVDMMPDTYKAIGMFLGFIIGWFIERRFIKYEIDNSKKQVIIALFCLLGLYALMECHCFLSWTPKLVLKFCNGFIPYIYITIIVPLILKKTSSK